MDSQKKVFCVMDKLQAIAEGVEVPLPAHISPCADKDTGFHKRYCWIKFSTQQDVQNVFQKDSHILEGAKLALKQQPRRRRSQRKNPSE
ncbi:PREDICTED: SRA stem-loop-interacting RNA-binding protein, mitochondrial [Nipponia nippon]|uniref:SRA stem-loop-interacting RNA-binding protein, mitochondrial n=1 Tax=Nipponia nippon TaxID=128390 RepID=UPI000510DFF5|nr:PREDICTED: SRA stem-loop-interacting RNA-binding protein, mitochondrial [Nipponia nippon]